MAVRIVCFLRVFRVTALTQIASCSSASKEGPLKANTNVSTSDFGKIVKMNNFVDKTRFIKTIFDDLNECILITAPRRFGKSTNMDMLKKFVEIQVDKHGVTLDKETSPNRKMFQELSIFKDKQFFDNNFATYPVIHVSFKPVKGTSFVEVLDKFRFVLHKAFEHHNYLSTSNKLDESEIAKFSRYYDEITYEKLTKTAIETGLEFLSKCLYKHFDKKVFVLIDEYDAPINNSMFEDNIKIEQVNKLLCSIFSHTLKYNDFVDRALLTGISYFASVGLSGANNIIKYMFLNNHDFVPYYGLIEDEVDNLFSKFKIDDETREKAKFHYNGYVSLNGTKLYSIWSVLHFLRKNEIENYWEQSGLAMNLEKAMNHSVIRYSIEMLCLGLSVKITLFERIEMLHIQELEIACSAEKNVETAELEKPDIYLNFLLQQGYLTFEKRAEDGLYPVKIPNAEILDQFRLKLFNHYGKSLVVCSQKCAVSFEQICTDSKDEIFNDFISKFDKVLDKHKERFVKHNEDTYHSIMFSILLNTKFRCSTEFTIPGGKVDIILCKDDLGIIMEFKYKKSSQEALAQIMTNLHAFNHHPSFKNVTRHIYIGLNLSENHVTEISVLVDSTDLKKARHLKFTM